ncbi:ATP-binding protein [Ornithinimicrobium humiphilum]|uniref:histidine kinase n=1 Tax=Ornithinimicrobium humiphilum TaxID=125288 RepID=A0A543K7K3_9MICO|nr:sensor histidine kinase [Ornithinimicrobium humiphilum]TQM91072.1 sensor histidine kinase regulating citrate/malate metabolism [Ornithinimicrobium humiphilum]
MRLPRLSLARQLLVLQVILTVVTLGMVAPALYVQSTSDSRRTAGNRVLNLAETFATDSTVRGVLEGVIPEGALNPAATRVQSVSGADFVVVLTDAGTVAATQMPDHLGKPWDLERSTVREGRAWVGVHPLDGQPTVQAHVPVLSADRVERLGYVVVGQEYPSFSSQIRAYVPNIFLYLGLAASLGVIGSFLLARRIKRQTLGLEPHEIVGLIDNREAFLYGIREGVVGLDTNNRVTLINNKAVELLDLDVDAIGKDVADLGLPETVARAFTDRTSVTDQVLSVGPRIVVMSQMPVMAREVLIGSVTTLRDRTELTTLRQELDTTRHTAEALRAQTHEFSNRLHTIAGLLAIGEPERAQDYVTKIRAAHNQLLHDVTSRILDPTLAALIIAKGSLASERGVPFQVAPATHLDEIPLDLAADLETIIGNFVDNALDAVSGSRDPWVELELRMDDDHVLTQVRDSGPGIPGHIANSLFEAGISTKASDDSRGIGLALARHVCVLRGGEISAHNEEGAVFTARLPWPQRP